MKTINDRIACRTSYHARMVAKYLHERFSGLPASVEVATKYRYRKVARTKKPCFLTISNSGRNADTLSRVGMAKELAILNTWPFVTYDPVRLVPWSPPTSLTDNARNRNCVSIKPTPPPQKKKKKEPQAFTTVNALLITSVAIAVENQALSAEEEKELVSRSMRSFTGILRSVYPRLSAI